MAGTFTTTAYFGAQPSSHMLPPYYADFLRENLYGSLYWRQLGTLVTIPRGMGAKVRISRWNTPVLIKQGAILLSAIAGRGALSAIRNVEEATISALPLCANSITGQVTGWAGARGYTDKVIIVSMANFLEGALESLSRELAYKLDRYARTKVSANAFTQFAVTPAGTIAAASKANTASGLFGKNLARIRPLMGGNAVPQWDDGSYVGIAHELAAYDIFADISATGYVSVARYNDARQIYRGEIGEFYGVRWLLSNASVIRIFGTAANSATLGLSGGSSGSNAYIFGPDAFYNLELETGGVEVIHQPLGSGGATNDPGAHVGSVAVKVFYGALPAPSTDNRVMRFVHGMTLHY